MCVTRISMLNNSSQDDKLTTFYEDSSLLFIITHLSSSRQLSNKKKTLLQDVRGLITTALGEIWAPLHSKGLHFQGYSRPVVQQKRNCEKNGAVKAVWE